MHYEMRDEILKQTSHPISKKVVKMKAGITTNYIEQTQCCLPDADMTKPELIEFTNSKIKEMFI